MSGFSRADHEHMARALRLAARGLYTTDPNPRVGCVLVRGGSVIGEAWHRRAGEPHAEVLALAAAGDDARGATAYVTLEPCSHHGRTPPCAEALADAGVKRVVAAVADPNPRVSGGGLSRLRSAGVETECGLLEAQARRLNAGFFTRMTQGRPWVRVKLASSLDGRTAMASGESRWVTGDAARRDVHRLRARSGGILTGIGTVLADDPRLTARDVAGEVVQPRRYVADSRLRLPQAATMAGDDGGVTVYCGRDAAGSASALGRGVSVRGLELVRQGRLPLAELLSGIAADGVNELMVEAGAELSGALLEAGLVDELVVYIAPHLMGHEAMPLVALPGIERMQDRRPLALTDLRRVGGDLRLTLAPPGDG